MRHGGRARRTRPDECDQPTQAGRHQVPESEGRHPGGSP
ncbi:hypothetical protein FM106_28300 [Brachybacterium faecium]|nr:hypothetical protein FM106_28300 [Brachybacterium faecium]